MTPKIFRYANVFWKYAQVGSPNITIQPGRPEANCALEIVKLFANDTGRSDQILGVSNIVIGPSADYGHVESGPGKDPSQIYLNADRIVNEAGGQQKGKPVALSTAQVIAHEMAHVKSFDPNQGFVGGEGPAEAAEQEFKKWLASGGMQKVENLPSYKALS